MTCRGTNRNCLWWATLLCAMAVSVGAQDVLAPFTATYNVEWRGINAGTSTLSLIRIGGDEYSYGGC